LVEEWVEGLVEGLVEEWVEGMVVEWVEGWVEVKEMVLNHYKI
jgi:hypothetical protein